TLSEESLRWHEPTPAEQARFRAGLPQAEDFARMMPRWDLASPRETVYQTMRRFQAQLHERLRSSLPGVPEAWRLMGLDPSLDGGKFEVHSMRPAHRIGPDGQSIVDLIVEVTQRRPVYFRNGEAVAEAVWVPAPGKDADFWFRGGCTLLIDPETATVR